MLRGQKKRKKLQEKLLKKLAAPPPRIGANKHKTGASIPRKLALSPLSTSRRATAPKKSTSQVQTSKPVHWGHDTDNQSDSSSCASLPPHVGSQGLPVAVVSSMQRTIPCYTQANNSCWLDVALQVLYVSASIDFRSFEERFNGTVSSDSLLYKLYWCISLRKIVQSEANGQNNNPRYLSLQRDIFREHLFKNDKPVIESMLSPENVFVSELLF